MNAVRKVVCISHETHVSNVVIVRQGHFKYFKYVVLLKRIGVKPGLSHNLTNIGSGCFWEHRAEQGILEKIARWGACMVFIPIRFNVGDKMSDGMGEAFITHGRERKYLQSFSRKPRRDKQLGKRRRRWDHNIKIDFTEISWEAVDWVCYMWLRIETNSGFLWMWLLTFGLRIVSWVVEQSLVSQEGPFWFFLSQLWR